MPIGPALDEGSEARGASKALVEHLLTAVGPLRLAVAAALVWLATAAGHARRCPGCLEGAGR
jgi:hypothetical protein